MDWWLQPYNWFLISFPNNSLSLFRGGEGKLQYELCLKLLELRACYMTTQNRWGPLSPVWSQKMGGYHGSVTFSCLLVTSLFFKSKIWHFGLERTCWNDASLHQEQEVTAQIQAWASKGTWSDKQAESSNIFIPKLNSTCSYNID